MARASEIDLTAFHNEQRALFPTARYGCLSELRIEALSEFKEALEQKTEEAIQKVLTDNPYLIQYALLSSGHHGTWVFPKPTIRPPGADNSKGMIPDYLVASRSSLGYFWHLVEIKRFDVQFSNKKGDGFSADGHKGIAQCNRYLTHFEDFTDTVRTNINIGQLIQPVGAILLIGNASTESEAQNTCRANFDRNSPKIRVVSYDRILHGLRNDLGSR
jgi:Domain of unknown function (DUF4263)